MISAAVERLKHHKAQDRKKRTHQVRPADDGEKEEPRSNKEVRLQLKTRRHFCHWSQRFAISMSEKVMVHIYKHDTCNMVDSKL